jgi:hypothetical protein
VTDAQPKGGEVLEEKTRTLDLRPLLAVAAVVAVVLTMWVAGAFAAGRSSGSSDSPASDSPATFLPTQDDGGQAPQGDDCPDDGSGGSGGGSGTDVAPGSGSSDL